MGTLQFRTATMKRHGSGESFISKRDSSIQPIGNGSGWLDEMCLHPGGYNCDAFVGSSIVFTILLTVSL
jgi:hypothetical protein